MSFGKSCNLGMIEPIAVIVIDAYSLVGSNPDVADGIHIKAGDGVAERTRNAVHKLRPVPALACKGMKSAAVCSDIHLVVLIYGKTASLAGNADLDFIAALAVELVENGFGQYPRFAVKIDLDVNKLGAEILYGYLLLSVKLKHRIAYADKHMIVRIEIYHSNLSVLDADVYGREFLAVKSGKSFVRADKKHAVIVEAHCGHVVGFKTVFRC